MPINKIAHFSVRTTNLDSSRRFYVELLGFHEGYRPPFDFPGIWLYRGGDEAEFGVVHIIGIDPDDRAGLSTYLGDRSAESLQGSGALDHVAFLASDLNDMLRRLRRLGLDHEARTVPSLGLHQLFVQDPSGITIELNFAAEEAGVGPPVVAEDRIPVVS